MEKENRIDIPSKEKSLYFFPLSGKGQEAGSFSKGEFPDPIWRCFAAA